MTAQNILHEDRTGLDRWQFRQHRNLSGRKDPGSAPRVPLDVRGTPFQHRVWEYLRTIPAGQTRSYAEVAEAVGTPRGARAVARACAANPVALVVPCHRVVRGDGRLGDIAGEWRDRRPCCSSSGIWP